LTKQHTLEDGIARAFEPGASGFPYYCTPPECVPDVIGMLAVWRHNSKKTKQKKDVVKVEGEDLATQGCLSEDRLRRYTGDSESWVRALLVRS